MLNEKAVILYIGKCAFTSRVVSLSFI